MRAEKEKGIKRKIRKIRKKRKRKGRDKVMKEE